MGILTSLILGLVLVLSSSCTQKHSGDATVKIKFDPSVFQGSAKSGVSAASTANSNGPNWGLPHPTSLSDISCWAIFVGGPSNEGQLNSRRCTLGNGSSFNFGPRGGFYGINNSGEVIVPAGSNRRFILVGMASADGTCDPNFVNDPDINTLNYSNPFILASKSNVALDQAEVQVEMVLQENFNEANRLDECDFFPENKSFTLQFKDSNRDTWIANNSFPRTVGISYNPSYMTNLECRVSPGNYTSCPNQTSFEWLPGDLTKDHAIRMTFNDGSVQEEIFKPSDIYGSLNFVNCNININMANNPSNTSLQTEFSSNIAPGDVVCFADGYSMDLAGVGPLSLTENTKLIVPQGSLATVENSSGGVFDFNYSGTGNATLDIYGLHLKGEMGSAEPALQIYNSSASDTLDITIIDAIIERNNSPDQGILASSLMGSVNVSILNSHVEVSLGSSAAALHLANYTHFYVYDSMIRSNHNAVYAFEGQIDILDNTTVESLSTTAPSIYISQDADVIINDSRVITNFGNAFELNCTGAGSPVIASLLMDGSQVARATSTAVDAGMIKASGHDGANCNIEVDSTNNNNEFCILNTDTFTSIITGSYDAGASSLAPLSNIGGDPGGSNSPTTCLPW